MNKIKLSLLTLGSIGAVVAPIATIVACNKNTPHGIKDTQLIVEQMDTSNLDSKPRYNVSSLQAEAKAIGWQDQVWKNGYLCESVSQLLNFVMNLAEQYGFNPAASTESNFVINDDMASKGFDSVWDAYVAKTKDSAAQKTDENGVFIKDKLLSLKAKNQKPTADQKLAANLTGGNQTFDGEGDYIRSNLEYTPPVDSKPLGDGVFTFQWYGKNGEQYDSIGNSTISRVVTSQGLAQKYPLIEDKKFLSDFAPFMKATMLKIMDQLQSYIGMMKGNMSTSLIDAIYFLKNKFTNADNTAITIDDKELYDKLNTLNYQRNINFLAIKALYLGYDDSFAQNGYEIWANDNWIQKNEDGTIEVRPQVAYGLRKDENSASKILTNLTNTSWAHTMSYYFNPSKSIEQNYAASINKDLNGKTPSSWSFDKAIEPLIAKYDGQTFTQNVTQDIDLDELISLIQVDKANFINQTYAEIKDVVNKTTTVTIKLTSSVDLSKTKDISFTVNGFLADDVIDAKKAELADLVKSLQSASLAALESGESPFGGKTGLEDFVLSYMDYTTLSNSSIEITNGAILNSDAFSFLAEKPDDFTNALDGKDDYTYLYKVSNVDKSTGTFDLIPFVKDNVTKVQAPLPANVVIHITPFVPAPETSASNSNPSI